MESAIKYILIVTYGGKPAIYTESDVADMHKVLVDSRRSCSKFRIINAQRCVVSPTRKTTFTEVRIDYDEDGLSVYDKYGSLIDRYTAKEPEVHKKRHFRIRREETWVNEIEVDADTETEGVEMVKYLAREEDDKFNVLDGWCEDVQTYVVEEITKEDEQ